MTVAALVTTMILKAADRGQPNLESPENAKVEKSLLYRPSTHTYTHIQGMPCKRSNCTLDKTFVAQDQHGADSDEIWKEEWERKMRLGLHMLPRKGG